MGMSLLPDDPELEHRYRQALQAMGPFQFGQLFSLLLVWGLRPVVLLLGH